MFGMLTLLNKLTNRTTLYWIFGTMVLLHLVVFIQYPFADGSSFFTSLGERAKSIVPYVLLITLLPAIHKRLDKISTTVINVSSLVFIALCIVYQIAGVSGQAWSTVAFSGLLILVLFNNILSRHTISKTIAFVFSFMIIWFGWVIFEIIFQTGLWFHYPIIYGNVFTNYLNVMAKMLQWLFPTALFMFAVMREKREIIPYFKRTDYRSFTILVAIFIITTGIWFSNGMLIPLPVDENGVMYSLDVGYWTQEHLEFSISRLSQISIMTAFAVLFFKRKVG